MPIRFWLLLRLCLGLAAAQNIKAASSRGGRAEMLCGKGRPRISWKLFGASSWLLGWCVLGLSACGPPWWRKGRPRTVHRSYAEVELLSRVAELLMPGEAIGELFRDFPVEPSDAWGASKFASEAVLTSDIETKKRKVIAFLKKELKYSIKGIQALAS
eukprot:s8097_g1.t1